MEFRLEQINNLHPRSAALLKKVAQQANWQWPQMDPNRALGIANYYFGRDPGSYLAQIVEVSLDESTGQIKVHQVYTAVDCGTAVNPAQVEAQIEGGSIMGLSFALKEELSFENGGVSDKDYRDYAILRMDGSPSFDTYVMPSDIIPGGVGDAANCLSAPAIANAVCNLIYRNYGKTLRLRDLPMSAEKVKVALNMLVFNEDDVAQINLFNTG